MENFGNLIIVRGIPGAGKSTFAQKEYVKPFGYKLVEADMYFMKNGIYTYIAEDISKAHDWCYNETIRLLRKGENVIVANTFTQSWELHKYLNLNPSKIYRCTGNFTNIHGVPVDTIKRMQNRFENIDGEIIL